MDIHDLITMVQKRPCLWNVSDKNHFNRELMQKHWIEVAQEVGSSYEAVKKKWKGLKDVFRKELKKTAASKTLSSWTHFHDMEFMKEQMSPRELPVPIESLFKTEMIEDGYDTNFMLRCAVSTVEQDEQKPNQSVEGDGSSSDDTMTQPDSNMQMRSLKRRISHEDEAHPYSVPAADDIHRDDDYNFLISFLPYLKHMNPKKKLLCRSKLCQLVYETAYSNDDN